MKYILFILSLGLNFSISWAQSFGVLIGDNVNLREKPDTESPILLKIEKDLTLLTIKETTKNKDVRIYNTTISDYPYHKVEYNGKTGYVYGLFVVVFSTESAAKKSIEVNQVYRSKVNESQSYTFGQGEHTLLLKKDGKLTNAYEGVIGDHIESDKGQGRYFIQEVDGDQKFFFYTFNVGEFAPDGISWAEYYGLGHSGKPSKAELDKFIAETKNYKVCHIERFELNDLSPKK